MVSRVNRQAEDGAATPVENFKEQGVSHSSQYPQNVNLRLKKKTDAETDRSPRINPQSARRDSIINVTTDNVIEPETSITANKLATDTSVTIVLPDVPPKQQTLFYPEMVIVGEDWWVVNILKVVARKNGEWLKSIETGVPKLLNLIWAMLVNAAYITFYVWYFNSFYTAENPVLNAVDMFLIVTSGIYFICSGIQIFYCHCQGVQMSEKFITFYSWICLIYCGLSIYGALIVFNYQQMLGWVFMSGIPVLLLIYFINMILWCILLLLSFLPIIVECIIRFFICRTECPHSEHKRLTFRYKLYAANTKYTHKEAQCPICLDMFMSENYSQPELCVSNCFTNHVFHEKCIFEWLKHTVHCPVCRGPIKLRDE